jgi:hypothetical protein
VWLFSYIVYVLYPSAVVMMMMNNEKEDTIHPTNNSKPTKEKRKPCHMSWAWGVVAFLKV